MVIVIYVPSVYRDTDALRRIIVVSSHNFKVESPSTFHEAMTRSPPKGAALSVCTNRFLPAMLTIETLLMCMHRRPHQAGPGPLPLRLSSRFAASRILSEAVLMRALNSGSSVNSVHLAHLSSSQAKLNSWLMHVAFTTSVPPTESTCETSARCPNTQKLRSEANEGKSEWGRNGCEPSEPRRRTRTG